YATVPLPLLADPVVMVIQLALLTAVNVAVLDEELTATVPFVPAAGALADAGLSENFGAVDTAAACVTGKVMPAMVKAPDRTVPALAVADQLTVPLPVPEVALVT